MQRPPEARRDFTQESQKNCPTVPWHLEGKDLAHFQVQPEVRASEAMTLKVERLNRLQVSNRSGVASERVGARILGTFVDALSWGDAVGRIVQWAARRESRTVVLCNVHSVVTARSLPAFASALACADMVTPDGAPVAWMLRRLGHREQPRLSGPDLMQHACERLQGSGTSVFLYGSTPQTLERLQRRLQERYRGLDIAGAISPPFGEVPASVQADHVARINASGAGVVFVGLGCPKQEQWCAEHRGRVNAVMLGVGAAFDFHAGTVSRAPEWMRRSGLEWLHRLASEPRRLWKRYLVTNTMFIAGAAAQLLRGKS